MLADLAKVADAGLGPEKTFIVHTLLSLQAYFRSITPVERKRFLALSTEQIINIARDGHLPGAAPYWSSAVTSKAQDNAAPQ